MQNAVQYTGNIFILIFKIIFLKLSIDFFFCILYQLLSEQFFVKTQNKRYGIGYQLESEFITDVECHVYDHNN